MAKKQKLPIILAVLIPIAMIALVAASVYLPRFYAHPQYDFLYYSRDAYCCDTYSISNGTIRINQAEKKYDYCDCSQRPKIYMYDAKTGESKEVAPEAAQKLALDPARVSPDGFKIANSENNGDHFPFYLGSSDYGSMYLKGNGAAFKIKFPDHFPYYNFEFLGWVK